jgi:cytochrome b561
MPRLADEGAAAVRPNSPDVYHDKSRLLRIDRWVRIFAWLYSLLLVLGLIGFVYSLATGFNTATVGLPTDQAFESERTWLKLLAAFGGVHSVVTAGTVLLMLLGISKAIRYLLALWEVLQHRSAAPLGE